MAVPEPIVYIVDDDTDVREVLAKLMASVGLETRTFASAIEFLDGHGDGRPGCVVLDVRMPGMSGTELQERLLVEDGALSIVFVSGHGDISMATHAMEKGAVAFLEKPFNNQHLLDTVQRAIKCSSDKLETTLRREQIRGMYRNLSERERCVFALVVDGRTNKEIAHDLGLSHRTVEVHRQRIMEKLSVRNVVELVRIAMDARLVKGLDPDR